MSEQRTLDAGYIYVTIPQNYLKVYLHILAVLADYGEEMLKDCKASCTDRNSGIIECFNMFNAAVAARELGKDKLAETLIKYVESMLDLNYKDVIIPDNINFPVREIDAEVFLNFAQEERFKVVYANEIPIEGISIQGDSSIEGVSFQYSAILNPENTTQTEVIWSIEGDGNNYAYIDSKTGLLYIKSNANHSLIKIKVQSALNSEIYDEKYVTCTYNNAAVQGNIIINANTDLDYNGEEKTINVEIVNSVGQISVIELCLIEGYNITPISSVLGSLTATFDVTLNGNKTYLIRATFADGKQLVSEQITFVGVNPSYVGAGKTLYDIKNIQCKLNPTLDIGSPVGKEYQINVANDGDYLYILVPEIVGHMHIEEVRLDQTNVSSFDMDFEELTGVEEGYKGYVVTLDGNGFKQGNYTIVITS